MLDSEQYIKQEVVDDDVDYIDNDDDIDHGDIDDDNDNSEYDDDDQDGSVNDDSTESNDGYNEDGYNRDGYNKDGYNKDGYNEEPQIANSVDSISKRMITVFLYRILAGSYSTYFMQALQNNVFDKPR
jgi:hypothetical protein